MPCQSPQARWYSSSKWTQQRGRSRRHYNDWSRRVSRPSPGFGPSDWLTGTQREREGEDGDKRASSLSHHYIRRKSKNQAGCSDFSDGLQVHRKAFLDVTTLRSINTHFLLTAVTLMPGTLPTVTHGGGRPVPHSRSSICSVATTPTGHTWEWRVKVNATGKPPPVMKTNVRGSICT